MVQPGLLLFAVTILGARYALLANSDHVQPATYYFTEITEILQLHCRVSVLWLEYW